MKSRIVLALKYIKSFQEINLKVETLAAEIGSFLVAKMGGGQKQGSIIHIQTLKVK